MRPSFVWDWDVYSDPEEEVTKPYDVTALLEALAAAEADE